MSADRPRLICGNGVCIGERCRDIPVLFEISVSDGTPLDPECERLLRSSGCIDLQGNPTSEGESLIEEVKQDVTVYLWRSVLAIKDKPRKGGRKIRWQGKTNADGYNWGTNENLSSWDG